MSTIRYTEEFKRDAVSQVTDRGYSVKEVSNRLGISTKSLYDWMTVFHKPEPERQHDGAQATEIRRLKVNLRSLGEVCSLYKIASLFSASNSFMRVISNASMLPYLVLHLSNEALLIPCSLQRSVTGVPASACFKILMI